MRLAEEVAVGFVGTFAAIVGGYGFFSFLLARSHLAHRGFGATFRELARETWLVVLTQPLFLLYYLLGDRMGAGASKTPIVLVHGYMQNRVGFLGLARRLVRHGLGPIYAINYPWFASIPSNAKRLERYVARVCKETNSPVVDLVCHSMGGLVAMEMMRSTAKKEDLHVRRCVTIATPHAGVTWRGPMPGFGAGMLRAGSTLLAAQAGYKLAVPTLSIYSSHDNIVYPPTTSSLAKRGGEDFEVPGMAHFSILFSPAVAEEVAIFLSKPEAASEGDFLDPKLSSSAEGGDEAIVRGDVSLEKPGQR